MVLLILIFTAHLRGAIDVPFSINFHFKNVKSCLWLFVVYPHYDFCSIYIEQKAKIYDLEKVLTISFYNISNPSRKVPVFNFPVTCVSCHGHDRQKFFILFMHYTCHIIPFTCSWETFFIRQTLTYDTKTRKTFI